MNSPTTQPLNRRSFCTLGTLAAASPFLAMATPALAAPKGNQPRPLKFVRGILGDGVSGNGIAQIKNGAVSGAIRAHNLPLLGTGQFFVAWYTNTENGNAAFLGALTHHSTILFDEDGLEGGLTFDAPAYTVHLPFPMTESLVGQPVEAAAPGNNLIVVLIETAINGRTPFPINPPVAGFPPGPVESLVLAATF
jgi:hypothetical protein